MDFSIAAGVRSTLETLEKVSSLEGVEREYTAFISYIAENAGALYDCKRLVRRMVNDALATLEMRFQNYNEDYKNGTTLHVIKELGKILWDRDDENNCQNVFGLLPDEIKIHIVKRFPFCDYLDVYKSNSNPVVNKALFVFETIFGCRDKFIYQKVLPAWINAQKIPLKVVSYQPFETLHTRLVLPWLQHIDLYQCVAPHAEHLSKLRFHTNVKTLRISDSNLCYSKNAKFFDHKQWAQLSDLTFQDCTITKSIVGELLNLNCLNSLVFHSVSFASDDDFSDLKKMTQLKKLCFISCLIDYDVTTAVKEFTSLQEFMLHEGFRNNRFTHGGFTNLRTLTNLKRLSIHNCFSLWKNGFSVLSLLTKLESLNVNGCCFMQEWNFAPVRGLTNLIELHASIPLRAHTNISDEYLTNLQNLRSLSITATQNNTVQSLTALKSLQILKINMQTANKDKDFSALAKIGSLEELNIEACHLTVRRLNDICRLAHLRILKITGDEPSLFSCELHSSLENLTLLEDLQSLSLTGLPLERCSFKAFSALRNLHSLTLSTKYRAKEIIADIFSITTLKELNFHINGCWNYKAGFMGILPNMTALDLSGTEIGDGQFNFATQFPNLEVLQLENCKAITDMTLYQLAGAANLRLLSVVNIPMITDDCVNEVFNTTLSLQMIRFHGRLVR